SLAPAARLSRRRWAARIDDRPVPRQRRVRARSPLLVLTGEHRQIRPHRAVEAREERVAHERMTDRHLVEVWQRAKEAKILRVEIVPGVDAEAELVRQLGALDEARERRPRLGLAALESTRVRLRVELDAMRARRRRPAHGLRIGLDEDAHAYAQALHLVCHRT